MQPIFPYPGDNLQSRTVECQTRIRAEVIVTNGFHFQLTKVYVRVGHEREVLVVGRGGGGEAEAVAAVPAEPQGLVLLDDAHAVPLAVGRVGERRLRQRCPRVAERDLRKKMQ